MDTMQEVVLAPARRGAAHRPRRRRLAQRLLGDGHPAPRAHEAAQHADPPAVRAHPERPEPAQAVHADEPALGRAVPRAGLPRVRPRRVRRGVADPAVGRGRRHRARRASWSWSGDSKQLPPTTFFQRSRGRRRARRRGRPRRRWRASSTSASPRGLPRLHLGWHYRSRHESLIAFSNHHYYEDGLYTFPSAVDDIAAASASRGATSRTASTTRGARARTAREAEALVEELVAAPAAIRRAPKRTFGVVTFSIAQQSLVEDLLEEARREHPELEPYFDDAREEPVFVKNLENVQGDERDVIFLSVCYGPDAQGRVVAQLRPAEPGGRRAPAERRGHALARAGRRLLDAPAEQIDLARTQARGARHLKAFLEYAEHGTGGAGAGPARCPRPSRAESAFEAHGAARRSTSAAGRSNPHVGCSGYRVDLGVEDPGEPGRFLTAVESDGVTLRRGPRRPGIATARAPACSEHLGWDHVRIWSIDWWQDPGGRAADASWARSSRPGDARARRGRGREGARAAPAAERAGGAADPSSEPAPPGGRSAPNPRRRRAAGHPARRRALRAGARRRTRTGDPRSFYDERKDAMIVRRIEKVIDTEAPVALGVVARRLADAWGLKHITTRLKDRVGSLIARSRATGASPRRPRTSSGGATRTRPRYDAFRVPSEGGRPERRARHVPREEVANAAGRLLAEHVSIELEDLARETARVFGYRRFTDKVRAPDGGGRPASWPPRATRSWRRNASGCRDRPTPRDGSSATTICSSSAGGCAPRATTWRGNARSTTTPSWNARAPKDGSC